MSSTFGETKLPYFEAPDGMDNQEYFEKLCREGLERRYPGEVTDALKERLAYEINVVKPMGYTNYYLIVYDFINYAKSQGYSRRPRPWFRCGQPGGLLRRHYRHRPHPLQPASLNAS